MTRPIRVASLLAFSLFVGACGTERREAVPLPNGTIAQGKNAKPPKPAKGPASIQKFEVDHAEVTADGVTPASVSLSWSTKDATSIELIASPGGPIDVSLLSPDKGSVQLPVTGSTSFQLVASNEVGQVDSTLAVTAYAAPQIAAFTGSPQRIGGSEPIDLAWQTIGAASVVIEKNGTPLAIEPLAPSGTLQDVTAADTTYVLRAYNALGYEVASEPVEVVLAPPVNETFLADLSSVRAGSDLTFSWTNDGGSQLWIVDEIAGTSHCSTTARAEIQSGGCTITVPLRDAAGDFTLHVANGAGEVTAAVAVQVQAGPVIVAVTQSVQQTTVGLPVDLGWTIASDAFGQTPTVTLVDDLGNAYDVSAADPNDGSVTIAPSVGGISSFTLAASTPGTTPASTTIGLEVYDYPVFEALVASPDVIDTLGGMPPTTAISWSVRNAVALDIYVRDQGVLVQPPVYSAAGADAAAGSALVSPPQGVTEYVAVARNAAGGEREAVVEVVLDVAEVVSFTASPVDILEGETSTLSWATSSSAARTLSPPWTVGAGPFLPPGPNALDVTPVAEDEGFLAVNLPPGFSFPWQGSMHTGLSVSTNGWIGFGTATSARPFNVLLPSSAAAQVQIAPFWDDLHARETGRIWLESHSGASGDFVSVSWTGFQFYSPIANPSDLNFQALLHADGSVEFRYGLMGGADVGVRNGGSATIGVQGPGGLEGSTWSYNRGHPAGITNQSLAYRPHVEANGAAVVRPMDDTDYRLQADNAYGSDHLAATVRVHPRVRFTALPEVTTPEPIAGAPFEIEWGVAYAREVRLLDAAGNVLCTDAADPLDSQHVGSCEVTLASTGPATIAVVATGMLARDTVTEVVSTEVYAPLELTSFTADASVVDAGQQVTLSWQTVGAAGATLTGNGVSIPLAGRNLAADSIQLVPASTTNYRLEITESGRTRSADVLVQVRTTRIDEASVAAAQLPGGGSTTLSWSATPGSKVWTSLDEPLTATRITDGSAPYVDVSGNPTATRLTGTAPFDFPDGFAFPFDGEMITSARVLTSAGFVSFRRHSGFTTANTALPYSGTGEYHPHLAPFWDGLSSGGGTGEVWYDLLSDADGRYLVIQWKNWTFSSSTFRPADLNFAVVLRDDGTFEYRYGGMSAAPSYPGYANGEGATIGYQDFRRRATQISFNAEVPGGLSNTTYRFAWEGTSPGSRTVAPSETTTYRICSSAAGYAECKDVTVVVVQNSDVIFTEFMAWPAAPSSDPQGEWFELRNMTRHPIDLDGWLLWSPIGEEHTIQGPLVIPPGETVVLARSSAVGFTPDYVYGDALALDHVADQIALNYGPNFMGATFWDATWAIGEGVSLSLDRSHAYAFGQGNHRYKWCASTTSYDGTNFGSPGTNGSNCSNAWYDIDAHSVLPFYDLEGSPNALELTGLADGSGIETVAGGIGFPFPFFGDTVTDLFVSAEGYLTFTSGGSYPSNTAMPSGTGPNNLVAAFWDSLGPSPLYYPQSAVLTELRTVGSRSVRIVQWNRVSAYSNVNHSSQLTTSLTFQAQLWDNGDIVTVVKELKNWDTASEAPSVVQGIGATVGIENSTGTEAVMFSTHTPSLYDGRAIYYRRR